MYVYFIKPGSAPGGYPSQYACLAAWLKQHGHRANFYDAAWAGETPEEALVHVDFSGVSLVAVSLYTTWQNWTRRFFELLKVKYPHIRTVVGGHHISALRELAVEHTGADFGIIGEGEIPLERLVDALEHDENVDVVPGIIYRDAGTYRCGSHPAQRVADLDELPFPDYDLIPPSRYASQYIGASVASRHREVAQVVTSRGCPHQCTFCGSGCVWERRCTFNSAARVVEHFEFLINKLGVREIWINDDGFTMKRSRTVDICERMIAAGMHLPIRFPNGVRLETLDEELLGLLKKIGAYVVTIGIETGSPEMMKKIKKRVDLAVAREKIALIKKHKIITSACFIVGFPEETEEQVEETIEFIRTSGLDRIQVCVFVPLPGSEEFNVIFGRNNPARYEENVRRYLYDGYMPDFLRHIDIEKIQSYYRKAILQFYTKPSVILSLIKDVRPRQILGILNHPALRKFFIFRRSKKEYVDLKA